MLRNLFRVGTLLLILAFCACDQERTMLKSVMPLTPEAENTEVYLTLNYDSPDALTPVNPRAEWSGYLGNVWEKTPDGKLPLNPQPFHKETFYGLWNTWLYSHAPSRLKYDLSGGNYTKFDAYLHLPNPCPPDIASVEMVCFADDVEVYRSGVLRYSQAQNYHIAFEIPENSKTLTISVTEGNDDGTCDHIIIGNARLLQSDSTIPDSHP